MRTVKAVTGNQRVLLIKHGEVLLLLRDAGQHPHVRVHLHDVRRGGLCPLLVDG